MLKELRSPMLATVEVEGYRVLARVPAHESIMKVFGFFQLRYEYMEPVLAGGAPVLDDQSFEEEVLYHGAAGAGANGFFGRTTAGAVAPLVNRLPVPGISMFYLAAELVPDAADLHAILGSGVTRSWPFSIKRELASQMLNAVAYFMEFRIHMSSSSMGRQLVWEKTKKCNELCGGEERRRGWRGEVVGGECGGRGWEEKGGRKVTEEYRDTQRV